MNILQNTDEFGVEGVTEGREGDVSQHDVDSYFNLPGVPPPSSHSMPPPPPSEHSYPPSAPPSYPTSTSSSTYHQQPQQPQQPQYPPSAPPRPSLNAFPSIPSIPSNHSSSSLSSVTPHYPTPEPTPTSSVYTPGMNHDTIIIVLMSKTFVNQRVSRVKLRIEYSIFSLRFDLNGEIGRG